MTSRRLESLIAGVSLLTVTVAVGCGGGGGTSTTPPALFAPTTVQANGAGSVTLKFSIPLAAGESSAARSPKSVPAGSKAIMVYAYPANQTVPAAPTSQCNSTATGGSGCLGDLTLPPPSLPSNNIQLCQPSGATKTCTITVNAPSGNDVFIVQLYDTAPTCTTQTACAISGTANLLATGATTAAISNNASNSVNIVLGAGTFGALTPGAAFSPPAQAATTSSTIAGGSLVFNLPAGSVPAAPPAQIGISTILQLVLPLSTARRPQGALPSVAPTTTPSPLAGNLLVYGLDFTLLGPTTLLQQLSLTGTNFVFSGTLASSLDAPGAVYALNVAMVSNGTYVDVGNLTYSYANNVLTVTGGTSGILVPGLYVMYLAPQSTVSLPIHVPPGGSGVDQGPALEPSPEPTVGELTTK